MLQMSAIPNFSQHASRRVCNTAWFDCKLFSNDWTVHFCHFRLSLLSRGEENRKYVYDRKLVRSPIQPNPTPLLKIPQYVYIQRLCTSHAFLSVISLMTIYINLRSFVHSCDESCINRKDDFFVVHFIYKKDSTLRFQKNRSQDGLDFFMQ